MSNSLRPHGLAWRISWIEESGGLQSTKLQRSGHDWITECFQANKWHGLACIFMWSQAALWKVDQSRSRRKLESYSRHPHGRDQGGLGSWQERWGEAEGTGTCLCWVKKKVLKKWKWSCSLMSDSANPWTIAYKASPSMGFSRQEYWSGLPFPSPEDLPNPRIKPRSPTLQADALPSEPPNISFKKRSWWAN